jgi:tetratricopeptide (TPR) repeat protein
VIEKLGRVLAILQRSEEALTLLEQAADRYRAQGNPEGEGRVIAEVGVLHRYLDRASEGIKRVEGVIGRFASSALSPAQALLYTTLSSLHFASGDYPEALSAAEQASALARMIGDEGLLAQAEMMRGSMLGALGHMAQSVRVLETALTAADRVGDLKTVFRVLINLAAMSIDMGELRQAREYYERSTVAAERLGEPPASAYLFFAGVLIYLGAWDEAHSMIDRGAELMHSHGALWLTPYLPLFRGQLSLLEGRWDQATQLLEESVLSAEPGGDLQALSAAHCLLAELEMLRGRPETARDRLNRIILQKATNQADLLATLAWSYLELDQLERAENVANQAVAMATAKQQRLFLIHALEIQGVVFTHQKRWEEALQALEGAIALADEISYPHAKARAHYELGRMYLDRKELEPAETRLREALSIFRALGAVEDVKRVERLLIV